MYSLRELALNVRDGARVGILGALGGDLDLDGDLDGGFGRGAVGGEDNGSSGRFVEGGRSSCDSPISFPGALVILISFDGGGGGRPDKGGSPGTNLKFWPTVGELRLSWSFLCLLCTSLPSTTALLDSSG